MKAQMFIKEKGHFFLSLYSDDLFIIVVSPYMTSRPKEGRGQIFCDDKM